MDVICEKGMYEQVWGKASSGVAIRVDSLGVPMIKNEQQALLPFPLIFTNNSKLI